MNDLSEGKSHDSAIFLRFYLNYIDICKNMCYNTMSQYENLVGGSPI